MFALPKIYEAVMTKIHLTEGQPHSFVFSNF